MPGSGGGPCCTAAPRRRRLLRRTCSLRRNPRCGWGRPLIDVVIGEVRHHRIQVVGGHRQQQSLGVLAASRPPAPRHRVRDPYGLARNTVNLNLHWCSLWHSRANCCLESLGELPMVRTRRLSRPMLVALTLASVAAFTASGGGLAASASGSPFILARRQGQWSFHSDGLHRRRVRRLRRRGTTTPRSRRRSR